MLRQVGSLVLEFKESFGKVVGHVKINATSRIILVNVNAAKEGAIPVHVDSVVFFQSCLEMEDLVARCGFDTKVVNQETEADVSPHVAP